MSEFASLVPEPERADYLDHAREICRRVQNESHLTDDELIVLAMVAAQLALARYVEPSHNADETIDQILKILDHTEIVGALENKMDLMLGSPLRGIARRNAPGGGVVKQLDLGRDPDEPAGR